MRGRSRPSRFERSRSRSVSRERSPVKKPSDSTSDPKTVNARVFIGSITPSVTREKIIEHFSKYGNVLGVSITKNKFGFVQFEKEEEAQECLSKGNYTYIEGNRIDVKPAKIGGGGGLPSKDEYRGHSEDPAMERNGRGGGYGDRSLSPMRMMGGGEYYDSYYRGDGGNGLGGGRPGSGIGEGMHGSREGRQYPDTYRDSYFGDSYGPRSQPPPYERESREPHSSTTRPYPEFQESFDPLDPSRPNDCEIVVPNKMQRPYAETIERELKRMNMLVDLLFPPPDILPSRVLRDLTTQRCLYAIFITAENEKMRTMTINILYTSTPQEHRAVPYEEGLHIIQRDFDEYIKKSRMRNARPVIPREIRTLFMDLLDLQPLSMGDLDKLIKYLRDRQNVLMDDQLDHKRTAGAAAGAGSYTAGLNPNVAITYPGYSYGPSTVQGPSAAQQASGVSSSNSAAAAAAAVATGSSAVVPGASTAASAAAYYGNYANYFGMYGMPGQVASPMTSSQSALGSQVNQPSAASNEKQSELQARILNMMKTSQGTMTTPTGVPAPAAVAAPTGVPAPNIVSQGWTSASKVHDSKLVHGQGSGQGQSSLFAAYNPWNQ